MKRTIVVVLAVIVWAVTVVGAEPAELTLRYDPRDPMDLQQVVDMTVTRVTMDKSPLGITGYAHGDLGYSRSPMDEQAQLFEMNLTLENVQQRVMQQAFDVPEKSETRVKVSALGAPQIDLGKKAEKGEEILDVPIRLLALLCHIIRFPEQKVHCGSEWSVDEALDLPDVEPMNLAANNTLINIEEGRYAVIESDVDAFISYFETPNPMGYGGPMPVMDTNMRITDMRRVFDMDHSVVTEAKGTVTFSADVDLGGQVSYVTAEGTFELKVRPEETGAEETSAVDTMRKQEQASEPDTPDAAADDASQTEGEGTETGAETDKTDETTAETDKADEGTGEEEDDNGGADNDTTGSDAEDTGGADDTQETEQENTE